MRPWRGALFRSQQTLANLLFTWRCLKPTLQGMFFVLTLPPRRQFAVLAIAALLASPSLSAQAPAQSPAEPRDSAKPAAPTAGDKTLPTPQTPAQIELLETRMHFASDGSSRKEVHARVRINTELGVRQFAHLNFDYNRSFESVEIPLARITHAGGGTADILPGAVSEQPNPLVAEASAYQDVRRKTVRILGLQPTDTLEYRVVTTASHHPLAPDFYLFHTFAKDAIVTQEIFELELPASPAPRIHINPATPATKQSKFGTGAQASSLYRWERTEKSSPANNSGQVISTEPDVAVTTFASWNQLAAKIAGIFAPGGEIAKEISAKSAELTASSGTPEQKIEALYDFVSQKIVTLDLPMGANGFRARPPAEILSAGYATPEDKMVLFAALLRASKMAPVIALAGAPEDAESQLPRPSLFTHALLWTGRDGPAYWLDPSMEVAPFRMIASNLRGKPALLLLPEEPDNTALPRWLPVSSDLPFPATQKVNVNAILAADGKLTAKVHYVLRGDNELLLRVAFHQTAKDKWPDLAQLLSMSDGFRGKVTNTTASDPTVTREPFTLSYEITMPKFVDWSKKPVRIPALLPQVGLPDPPAKAHSDSAVVAIDLGTPLDVETRATLELPPGTVAHAPTGTAVERDYATFTSHYAAGNSPASGRASGGTPVTLNASRHIQFLLREVPASRVTDYKAFMHAVQNDEAQDFTLERAVITEEKHNPAMKKSGPSEKSQQ
jgi:hypothetical protein